MNIIFSKVKPENNFLLILIYCKPDCNMLSGNVQVWTEELCF